MFKLVVLSALVAVAVAKPSAHHHEALVAAPIVTKTYVSPAAVSSTYREDVISKPAHVTYTAAAPVYAAKALVAEPVAIAAPLVTKTVVAPAAVSHTYREDIVSKPAHVAYAAPAVAYAAPLVHKTIVQAPVAYAAPAAVSSSYRTDLVSSPLYAKTIVPSAYAYAGHGYAAHGYAAHVPAVQAW